MNLWKHLCKKWFPKTGFPYRFKNILNVPKFTKEIIHIFKNGYPYMAMYNNDLWFLEVEQAALRDLAENGCSYPCRCKDREEWVNILYDMIDSLEYMKEDGKHYKSFEEVLESSAKELNEYYKYRSNSMNEAKDHFMELFNEWFYNLWD